MKYYGQIQKLHEICTIKVAKQPREIKEYINNWRGILCLWMDWKIQIVNVLSRWSVSRIKIVIGFFFLCRNWQADSKVHMEMKRLRILTQNNIEKGQCWRIYYKAVIIMTGISIKINKSVEPNRVEKQTYICQFIFDKDSKTMQWWIFFSVNGTRAIVHPYKRSRKGTSALTSCHILKST